MEHPLILAEEVANRARSVAYLVGTLKFQEFYNEMTDKDKERIAQHIRNVDPEAIRAIMTWYYKRELHNCTVRELRKIAANHGVSDYHIMHKAELLSEIENARRRQEAPRTDEGSCDPCGSGRGDLGSVTSEVGASLPDDSEIYSWSIDVHF